MASQRFLASRGRWEVRKQFINPRTRKTHKLYRLLEIGATEADAANVAIQFDEAAAAVKAGAGTLPGPVGRAQNEWFRILGKYTHDTEVTYRSAVTGFVNHLPKSVKTIDQVRPVHLEDFLTGLLDDGKSAKTCNTRRTAIKSFAAWCRRRYKISDFTAGIDRFTEDDSDPRCLSEDEYQAVIAAWTQTFRDRAEFLGNTGVRITELCHLTWTDVRPVEGGEVMLRVFGKGRKLRWIPLNSVCLSILERLKNSRKIGQSHIFISKSTHADFAGGPIKRSAMTWQCKQISQKLGIGMFGPHAFRHYFATKLLLAGVPMSHVSKLLGHASIKTTEQTYAHIQPHHLAGITECLCG